MRCKSECASDGVANAVIEFVVDHLNILGDQCYRVTGTHAVSSIISMTQQFKRHDLLRCLTSPPSTPTSYIESASRKLSHHRDRCIVAAL